MAFSAVTLFCDDIRTEQSGMDMLIGILPDNVNIGVLEPPPEEHQVAFPKLGIYTRIVVPLSEPGGAVSVSVQRPDGTSFKVSAGFTAERIEQAREEARSLGASIFGLIVRAVIAPFPVTVQGRYIAAVTMGDREQISGNLNVALTPAPATAPSPPS